MFGFDVFGRPYFLKGILMSVCGMLTFRRYKRINPLKIEGTEHLAGLPGKNVLFVSNHQTYFADVIAMLHVFSSAKRGFHNSINNPAYLLAPKTDNYFIAADETMRDGIIPKLFVYAGCVKVKRTWRDAGQDVNRKVDFMELAKIGKALTGGWLITFPQGTTTPFAPGRRGVTYVIKKYKPVVVPIVISGFMEAFDKKGLKTVKRGQPLEMRFKRPMQIDLEEDGDVMLEKIMKAIEQSEEFQPKDKQLEPVL